MRQFKELRKSERRSYDLKPNRTLKRIYAEVRRQQELFGSVIRTEILPELEEVGSYLLEREFYTEEFKQRVLAYYDQHLAGTIEVIDLNATKDIPFLKNHKIYLIHRTISGGLYLTYVPIDQFGRFISFSRTETSTYVTFLEDIIASAIERAVGDEMVELISIKMSRDLETYIEDEFTGDLIEKIKVAIELREGGQPTRLLFDQHTSKEFQQIIRKRFGLNRSDMIEGGSYHNFSDFMSYPPPIMDEGIYYEPMPPLPHPTLEKQESLLSHLQKKDEMLHFPYQKFDYIPQLIREAGDNAQVKEIKISLYRIAKSSDVVKALCYAIERGKKVVTFVEAKARFDEKNNLLWGKELEDRGATVIYSYPAIKIHSKIVLIRMQPDAELKDIGYIGTGNFNEKTARIYSDFGLLTSKKSITRELNQVFHVLQRKIIVPKTKTLIVSPFTTRRYFEDLIDRAIQDKRAGMPAHLFIKMNSLEDAEMIDKLYQASQAGVSIRMIIRGFCCLRAGVAGLSENIFVTSIIDRFLEHARVYYYNNGEEDLMIFGSADWMTRNLDRRIEVSVPILDEEIKEEMLRIMSYQINDNVKSRIIDDHERNEFVIDNNLQQVRAQFDTYQYLQSLLDPVNTSNKSLTE